MNYLEGLSEEQKKAVLSTAGPVSVLAGAGSGKTRVLTTRIYHLIREGVAPGSILAITFTNKAAREMRERLYHLLPTEGATEIPFIATFHGLGRELLQQYGHKIGVSRYFSIFDRDDSKSAIKKIMISMGIDPKELSPGLVLSRISKAKGDGKTKEDFRAKEGQKSFESRIAGDIWVQYEEALQKEKALDFDDLLSLPVKLLEEHADVRAIVQERFKYVHVDEYQDTNDIQARLMRLIAENHKNIFVVGDADQLIYGWRGANIDNILNFENEYKGAQTLLLEHNYRSTKTIVAAANQVIEKNIKRKEKTSTTNNADGENITVHIAMNAEDEARWVAKKIEEMNDRDVAYEDVAILFRTNAQSRALEEALLRRNIPYTLLGTRFLDRKEVKDVIAWTRLVLDPTREADRMRAVQAPVRGIGKVTLGKLLAGQRDLLKKGELEKVEQFELVVAELHEAAQKLPPSALIKMIVEKSGLEAALKKEGEEGIERLENIRELGVLASRYDHTPGLDGAAAFIAEVALSGDQDEMDRKKSEQEIKKGITLMTVHAAKGLEFDTVFITGMEEGLFPHEGMGEGDRDEEEERRLFYVALTRAKKKLYLTLARVRRIYGTDYAATASSFLNDIDPGLTELDMEDPWERSIL